MILKKESKFVSQYGIQYKPILPSLHICVCIYLHAHAFAHVQAQIYMLYFSQQKYAI